MDTNLEHVLEILKIGTNFKRVLEMLILSLEKMSLIPCE